MFAGSIGPAAYHGARNACRRWCRVFRGLDDRQLVHGRRVLREDFGTFGFVFFTTPALSLSLSTSSFPSRAFFPESQHLARLPAFPPQWYVALPVLPQASPARQLLISPPVDRDQVRQGHCSPSRPHPGPADKVRGQDCLWHHPPREHREGPQRGQGPGRRPWRP